MTGASFSVVAMVRETPDVLERFSRHYLGLGAESVRLYFDGEADEAIVPDLPGVEVTVCDRLWWIDRLGREPAYLDEGLMTVFCEAHDSATADWTLFCDADEFLVSEVPVGEMLSRAPSGCDAVRVMNMEAVWGPGDDIRAPFGCTHFRMALSPKKQKLLRALLPARRWTLFGRQGFAGHPFGKHFLRRGAIVDRDPSRFTTHRSSRDGASIGVWADSLGYDLRTVFLAHFDAVSLERWTEKWRRRLSSERPDFMMGEGQRKAQADAIREGEGKGDIERVFRELYGLTRYEAIVLGAARALVRRRIFPDPGGR